MTKTDFIRFYSLQNKSSIKDSKEQVNSLFATLSKALEASEEVNIPGFGKFTPSVSNNLKLEVEFKPASALRNILTKA